MALTGGGTRAGDVTARCADGLSRLVALMLVCVLAACSNSPHPLGAELDNTLFNGFAERSPRYLDPTSSYSVPETPYVYQIYEPPYRYHYLKRPYTLEPATAEAVVAPTYLDRDGRRLADDAPVDAIAQSVYELHIRPGILYAPHPAFARDAQGELRYHHLSPAQLGEKRSPWEFEFQGTRELVAEDYVYAFKRQASPRQEAPIFELFSEYVVGLKDYAAVLAAADAKLLAGLPPTLRDKPFLDLRRYPLAGVDAPDKYTLRIRIKGKYPQWKYWLALAFSAPMPWEAEAFYSQPGMAERSLSLNQWPVGTGPYMMTQYLQDRRHVMKRNPNFRGVPYPCEGEPGDAAAGLLADCGKRMPFIDTIVSEVDKERGPAKEKFRQGYLDVPEIERTDWGVEFRADMNDSAAASRLFAERGFKFPQSTDIANWYLGFNWLDPVVGKGDTPEQQRRNRLLRQAISIAIDWEEGYEHIFLNKGGSVAHGPVPPGLFGSREGTPQGFNPITHHVVEGRVVRRPIADAKQLLVEAGYPGGRDAASGKPLVLNYDYQRAITPELKTELDWMVKQFAKIGIQLEIRATDFNQFQDKMLKGKAQVFWWGWQADYPDAENFLFLLYGPNGKFKHGGQNSSNYENAEYDGLYRELQTLDDGPRRQQVIDRMVEISRQDAVWAYGFFPWAATAFQPWVHNGKTSALIKDMAQYYRLDVEQRAALQAQWNRPVMWPMALLLAGMAALGIVAWRSHVRRETATATAAAC